MFIISSGVQVSPGIYFVFYDTLHAEVSSGFGWIGRSIQSNLFLASLAVGFEQ